MRQWLHHIWNDPLSAKEQIRMVLFALPGWVVILVIYYYTERRKRRRKLKELFLAHGPITKLMWEYFESRRKRK